MVLAEADGCDISKGLMESTNQQQQYEAYKARLNKAKGISLGGNATVIVSDVKTTVKDVSDDLKFIHSGIMHVGFSI